MLAGWLAGLGMYMELVTVEINEQHFFRHYLVAAVTIYRVPLHERIHTV